MPTTPPLAATASSCSSVRLRVEGQSACAFECVATSGALESAGDVPEAALVQVREVDEQAAARCTAARAARPRASGPGRCRARPGSGTARPPRKRSAGSRRARPSGGRARRAARARADRGRSGRRPRGAGSRRASRREPRPRRPEHARATRTAAARRRPPARAAARPARPPRAPPSLLDRRRQVEQRTWPRSARPSASIRTRRVADEDREEAAGEAARPCPRQVEVTAFGAVEEAGRRLPRAAAAGRRCGRRGPGSASTRVARQQRVHDEVRPPAEPRVEAGRAQRPLLDVAGPLGHAPRGQVLGCPPAAGRARRRRPRAASPRSAAAPGRRSRGRARRPGPSSRPRSRPARARCAARPSSRRRGRSRPRRSRSSSWCPRASPARSARRTSARRPRCTAAGSGRASARSRAPRRPPRSPARPPAPRGGARRRRPRAAGTEAPASAQPTPRRSDQYDCDADAGGNATNVPELEWLRRRGAGAIRGGAPIAITELPGHMDLAAHGLHPEGRVTRNPSTSTLYMDAIRRRRGRPRGGRAARRRHRPLHRPLAEGQVRRATSPPRTTGSSGARSTSRSTRRTSAACATRS